MPHSSAQSLVVRYRHHKSSHPKPKSPSITCSTPSPLPAAATTMDQDQSAALELHQKGQRQSLIYIFPPRRAPTDHHQTARTELSINPLTWDTNLSNNAQNYANQLASQDSGLDHDNQKTQGENLAYCSGSWTNPLTESTELWYAEKEDWTGDDDVAQIQESDHRRRPLYSGIIWVKSAQYQPFLDGC
jgi:hypothetical protein